MVAFSLALARGFMAVRAFAARSIIVTIPSTATAAQGQTLATDRSREGVLIGFLTSKETKCAMDAVTRLADTEKVRTI
jgi:DNA topoisomerase IA